MSLFCPKCHLACKRCICDFHRVSAAHKQLEKFEPNVFPDLIVNLIPNHLRSLRANVVSQPPRAAEKAGYSLVELMTVIAIITIAVGVAATHINFRSGRPVDASQIVSAEASAAQSDAVSSGNPTRVIACIDPSNGSRYLQYVATLRDVQTDPTKPALWAFSSKGQTLPSGTFLWTDYSTLSNTMTLDPNFSATAASPGQTGISGTVTYAYIEFDATGQLAATTSSGQVQNFTQWVFAHGVVGPGVADPEPTHVLDRDGFIVRRLGKIAYFASPGQIQQPSP
jgi:prepilin-type N-terminal cleavage/methylation domain-containing protein